MAREHLADVDAAFAGGCRDVTVLHDVTVLTKVYQQPDAAGVLRVITEAVRMAAA